MNSVEKKVHDLEQFVKALNKRVTDLEAAKVVTPSVESDPPATETKQTEE